MQRLVPTLVLCALACGAATAQAPDCSGISDVSDFDGASVSPMDGQLTTVRVASGLLRPLFVASPPGDLERLFIVEQDGTIRILKNGTLLPTPFLDISDRVQSPADGWANEEGLLGLAFHPDFSNNGYAFVYFTGNGGTNYSNLVERYTVSATDPDVADPASRERVIQFPHPTATYHHGGMLAFGPQDGRLYISTGDGALSPCDPTGNAQNLESHYGKLLRLDVDQLPYATLGNPFDGAVAGRDEIWAFGLRNPWRYSFDRENGTLYIGDVGQFEWEEVNCVEASSTGGENYGWDNFEGTACPNPSCGAQGSCALDDYMGPILEYTLSGGRCTIIGGYVYRGCRMSDLHGTYFYADLCSGDIDSFRTDASCSVSEQLSRSADLAPGAPLAISQITSFGEDARGELYVVDRAGEVFKVLPTLSIMEVSGENAISFQPGGAAGDWTWEDLAATSSHPITNYKVYRSNNGPSGSFVCVHEGAQNVWTGGDPEVPDGNQVFFYLVTALDTAGEQTRSGNRSDGTPRTVDTGLPCS